MYFVHFYFVIEKKKSHLFVLNFLFKIVMGQPNFRHSDCQLCIFLQPYICFNYYKNNTFFRISFFFFIRTNKSAKWVSNDCMLQRALAWLASKYWAKHIEWTTCLIMNWMKHTQKTESVRLSKTLFFSVSYEKHSFRYTVM